MCIGTSIIQVICNVCGRIILITFVAVAVYSMDCVCPSKDSRNFAMHNTLLQANTGFMMCGLAGFLWSQHFQFSSNNIKYSTALISALVGILVVLLVWPTGNKICMHGLFYQCGNETERNQCSNFLMQARKLDKTSKSRLNGGGLI